MCLLDLSGRPAIITNGLVRQLLATFTMSATEVKLCHNLSWPVATFLLPSSPPSTSELPTFPSLRFGSRGLAASSYISELNYFCDI